MIKITDVTLCSQDSFSVLENNASSKEMLLELYQLLLQTGISLIEINVPIYELLGESIDADKTILRIQDPTERKYYPGFIRYVCRYSGYDTPLDTISEIQINDIREVNLMKKFSEYQCIRIVGLDDLMQHDYISVFRKIKSINLGQIEFCPQNSYYCASALATEWMLNDGQNVAVSFLGSGGFAALEEVIMALRITKRYKPNMNLSVFRRIKNLYEQLTGESISKNKSVIGDSIFDVESGIHVDGIYKNGANYEPFEPSVVGMERKIVIGKHSGRTTIEVKLKEKGISCSKDSIVEILSCVQEESIRLRRSITDEEFQVIANRILYN